jgi:hypothetical protein
MTVIRSDWLAKPMPGNSVMTIRGDHKSAAGYALFAVELCSGQGNGEPLQTRYRAGSDGRRSKPSSVANRLGPIASITLDRNGAETSRNKKDPGSGPGASFC